jgi:hypothetical protein
MRYLRIQDGKAVESINVDSIEGLFHPDLIWIPSETAQLGDVWDGTNFSTPIPLPPTNAELLKKIVALQQKSLRSLVEDAPDTTWLDQYKAQIIALRNQMI